MQIAARGLHERDLGVDVTPLVQPLPRVDEGNALTAVGTEAKAAVAGRWLEHPSPTRPERLVYTRRLALADDRDQLFATHGLTVERATNVVDQLPELWLFDLDELQPGVARLDPAAAHRGRVERQIIGPREVQRATHQPRLHGAVGPERLADIVDGAIDADGDLELRCGHELRLGATDLAHDPRQIFLRCPASQVVALQAERVDLGPGQLGFRLRQGLQRASVEERGAPGHELVAARAGADEVDGRADELTDPLDVVAAVRG